MVRTQIRLMKFVALISACGVLPAWLLRCDRAALNLQRGFWYGLGDSFSDLLVGMGVA